MNFSPSTLFGLLGLITGVFSLGFFWQHKDYQKKINDLSQQISSASIKKNHNRLREFKQNDPSDDMALLLEANLAKQASKSQTIIDRQDGRNYSVNKYRLTPKEVKNTSSEINLQKNNLPKHLELISSQDVRPKSISLAKSSEDQTFFLASSDVPAENQHSFLDRKNVISKKNEFLIYLGLFASGYLALKIAFNTNLNLSYLVGIFLLLSLLIWNCFLAIITNFKQSDFQRIKKVIMGLEQTVSVVAICLTLLLVANFQPQYFFNYDNWSTFWLSGGGLIWTIILALKLIFRILAKYSIKNITKTLPLDILQSLTVFLISLSSLLVFSREFIGIILAMLVLFVALVYILAIRERNRTLLIKNLIFWLSTWTVVAMALVYNNVLIASFFGLVMMVALKYIGLVRRYRYSFFISNVLILMMILYFSVQVFGLNYTSPIIAWIYLLASIYFIFERQALIKRKIGWQFLASISYCLGFVLAIIFGYLAVGESASGWNLILISIIMSILVCWLSIIEKQAELIAVASLPFYLGLVQFSGVGKFDMNFLAILMGCGSLIWLLISILIPKKEYKNYFLIGTILGPFLNFLTTFQGITKPWALVVNLLVLIFVIIYQNQVFGKKNPMLKYLAGSVLVLNIFWLFGLVLGGKYLNLSISVGVAIMVVMLFVWLSENKKNNYSSDHQVLIN